MTSAAAQSESAAIIACTVARDVQNFDLLIEDMEAELGENWGDLDFDDATSFLKQPEASELEFIAIAVDGDDEGNLAYIGELITKAKETSVKVILIADDVSPGALHQLLRLGADDFVPYPLPENALHDAIERIRNAASLAAANPNAGARPVSSGKRNGMIFPVHGFAGGTGSSTFAVNLAWELANVDKTGSDKVCLLDLDFQFGSASTYLDLPRPEAVYDMLIDIEVMTDESFKTALSTFNDKLHVLTAPPELLPLDIIGPEDIKKLIEVARRNFDFVVIDMPSTFIQWTETVLSECHAYFGLMEMDLRSAQNTLRIIRALKSEELPYEKLRYVLSKAPGFTDMAGKSRAKRLAESLDIEISVQLPDGGKMITQSCDQGLPLSETAAKSPLRKEIAKLALSLHQLSQAEALAD